MFLKDCDLNNPNPKNYKPMKRDIVKFTIYATWLVFNTISIDGFAVIDSITSS